MNKRFTALILALILAICGLVPAALSDDEQTDTKSPGWYYVVTKNGKGLNVRNAPDGDVVGSLRNGSRVYVKKFTNEKWALITYTYSQPGMGRGEYPAFISRRFLSRKKPEETAQPAAKTAADPLEEMNKEFKAAQKVTPYKVIVRPARVSGWVNMHWAPSNSSEVLATYKADDVLLVISELPNWLQVEDQDTGNTGFISKQFVME